MEEELRKDSYEVVEGYIARYPGNDRIEFANERLNQNKIYRGLASGWERFSTTEFTEFLKENGILPATVIAIARDSPNTFSVIQIINF